MRSRAATTVFALLAILAGGALRLPFERDLTAEFRQRGLLGKPIDIGVRERIGQDKWSVALAGLRTLVAAFAGLRATEQFSSTDWSGLADSMDTAVELAPHTEYYWDIGAWHMAYNASSSYRFDRKEEDWSRQLSEDEGKRWIMRGREFYERGLRNNPDSPMLAGNLGHLYSDRLRYPDDAKAVEAYRQAVETGRAEPDMKRFLLMARARTGRDDPAKLLADLESLLAEDRTNRVNSMLCLQYVLQSKLAPDGDPLKRALRIFGNEPRALRVLGTYYTNVEDRMPQDGVGRVVRLMEMRVGSQGVRLPVLGRVPWKQKGPALHSWLTTDEPPRRPSLAITPDNPRSYIRQREEMEIIARYRWLGR